jgi:uncharacterized protein (DUF2336 family)
MSPPINFMADVESAITNGGGGRRSQMLRRVTDLFVGNCPNYTAAEIALFDDVIGLLAAEIETAARVTLAAQLAPVPNAPPRIISRLATDEAIEVAWPVLAHSECVDEQTLIQTASTRSQQHMLAICRRKTLGERVTDVMIARGERPVLAGLANNDGAKFSDLGYATLVDRSEGDDDLMTRIGLRNDVPRQLFIKLLDKASAEVRTRLSAAHPDTLILVNDAVRKATNQVHATARAESPRYNAAQPEIEKLHRLGRLRDAEISRFAAEKKFEETVVALAILCELKVETVERAMIRERSETALIFVKAAGLSRTTAKAVLHLCGVTNGGTEHALASFDKLKPATAGELVRHYRLREGAAAPSPASAAAQTPQSN